MPTEENEQEEKICEEPYIDQSQPSKEMPKYQSHKIVHALKIKAILTNHVSPPDGSIVIVPEEDGFANFRVEKNYVEKHNPQIGGYYVVYDDGYTSWSPAKAFEEGYTRF